MMAMLNSKSTAALTGAFAWETFGLLAHKPILATGTHGFYSLSFLAIGLYYYGGIASGSPEKLAKLSDLYQVGYILKPSTLDASAVTGAFRLVDRVRASHGEEWEIWANPAGPVALAAVPSMKPVGYAGDALPPKVIDEWALSLSDVEAYDVPVVLHPRWPGATTTNMLQLPKAPYEARSCQVEVLEDRQTVVRVRTSCPDRPHILRRSFHPGWVASTHSKVYQVLPNHILLVPNASDFTLELRATSAALVGKTLFVSGVFLFVLLSIRRATQALWPQRFGATSREA